MNARQTPSSGDRRSPPSSGFSDSRPALFSTAALREHGGPHRIVIVGGGAGGLELAVHLGEALRKPRRGDVPAEVLLIDSALTHVWKPWLHEMAAGTLSGHDSGVEFLQLARRHGFRFHLGTLESLDRGRHELWLSPLDDDEGQEIAPRRAVAYDTLVVAVGSIVNDFRTPGVAEHALRLDSAADAMRFHRLLLAECARAEVQSRGPVEVAIVGGGATGVELSAELVESVRAIAGLGTELRQEAQPMRLHLIESGPRLVGALPEDISRAVQADLEARGVEVLTGRRVTEVAPGHVVLDDHEIVPAALTVWAAGIRGPAVLERLDGLELNRSRQLLVRDTLQTTRDADVFAMGDCASCVPEAGAPPVPPRAQAAQQEARYLSQALLKRLRAHPVEGFRFHDRGALVSLGSRDAIGRLAARLPGGGMRLQGLLARWAYWSVHHAHMVRLQGALRTAVDQIGHWIDRRTQPRVKLH
ncbi:NAD(P)/FAD-dependent oxidoreductase [Azohydromonas aeria]|uniref:NAD(P)/FAD-dependent oxidoreductase n=1 Tax=Azohydromonas aeria TaxID=2590212 RepID=UPI0012F75FC7|nr:NAD(P)/FAD-dependent oxidoreductase [Azohydromonas aeria]